MNQRTDQQVIDDARKREAVVAELRRWMRRAGIRPRTRIHSEAFERAVSMPNRLPPVRGRGE